jgi:hypothetical protein
MAPKPKFVTLKAEHESPSLAAADLVMAILKHTLCSSLDDLRKHLDAGEPVITAKLATLIFDESQVALIEDQHEVASIMRIGPTVSVAECSGCHRTIAVEGAAPRTCGVTLGCEGTLTKSTVAKKNPYVTAE